MTRDAGLPIAAQWSSVGLTPELPQARLVLLGALAKGIPFVEDLLGSAPTALVIAWGSGLASVAVAGRPGRGAADEDDDQEHDAEDDKRRDNPHPAHAPSVAHHGLLTSFVPSRFVTGSDHWARTVPIMPRSWSDRFGRFAPPSDRFDSAC